MLKIYIFTIFKKKCMKNVFKMHDSNRNTKIRLRKDLAHTFKLYLSFFNLLGHTIFSLSRRCIVIHDRPVPEPTNEESLRRACVY